MSLQDTVQNVTHTSHPTYGRRRAPSRGRVRKLRAGLVAAGLIVALSAAVVAFRGGGESVAAARATADSALEKVDDLGVRIDSLESELRTATEALNGAENADRAFATELDRVSGRLQKALGRLRRSTAAASKAAESAASNSSSALATAEQVARRLNVLQERYDYHLRRYHGGG